MSTVKVVKIGGNVVDNDEMLEAFCKDFAALEGPKVLVHGGGAVAGEMQRLLGMEPVKIEGRRVTDAATLKVVTMVYAGLCNKKITALLQKYGCNAIGLSGCDADVIRASRRAPRTLSDGVTVVDYGFVGDVKPEGVNEMALFRFVSDDMVPVICAINHDGQGNLLNTNADTIASSVAVALKSTLVYCFEKKGVLGDVDDDDSVISEINRDTYASLKAEGVIADGMIPKIDNAFAALEAGAQSVIIKSSSDLLDEVGGTLITLQ